MALERKLLHSQAWKDLPGSEKILYLHIKARYDSNNNGKIIMPYTAMSDVQGCSSPAAVSAAFKGLIEKGWIERTQAGGLYRKINKYGLTWKWDLYDSKEIFEERAGITKKR